MAGRAVDPFEDLLHSVAASAVGFGFTVGVLLVAARRGRDATAARVFDGAAVVVALGISLMVVNVAGYAGVARRFMFGVGYVWYGLETVRASRAPSDRSPGGSVDVGM